MPSENTCCLFSDDIQWLANIPPHENTTRASSEDLLSVRAVRRQHRTLFSLQCILEFCSNFPASWFGRFQALAIAGIIFLGFAWAIGRRQGAAGNWHLCVVQDNRPSQDERFASQCYFLLAPLEQTWRRRLRGMEVGAIRDADWTSRGCKTCHGGSNEQCDFFAGFI